MVKPVDKIVQQILEAGYGGDTSALRRLHAESPQVFENAIRSQEFQCEFVDPKFDFDRDTLATFVELGVNPNRHDKEGFASGGFYALINRVMRNDLQQARFLLELGADPDLCDALESVAYIEEGPDAQIAMAQLLIDFGADVNRELPNLPGYTPLCRAVDNGCQELAEFLMSQGALMPVFPDEEEPELDLATFQERLETACRACWEAVRGKFPNERFCLFGLETDSDFVILNPLWDSEGAVERDAENRRPSPSYVGRISLDCDSEFYGKGREHLKELSFELNSRYGADETKRERSDRIKTLLGIFESALNRLDDQGLFGKGADRERIILMVSIIDADGGEWRTMMKIAKRLNPTVVFTHFKRSLR